MQVNIPEVVAELVAAFEAYERALVGNDIEAVNNRTSSHRLTESRICRVRIFELPKVQCPCAE